MFDWLLNRNRNTITVDELAVVLANAEDSAFVDVREPEEWHTGHIEGFRHIPLGELEKHMNELMSASRVYLLCHSGRRSGHASDILTEKGHPGAINVVGGWSEWVARGYPIGTLKDEH